MEMSFFGDVEIKTVTEEKIIVSREECELMVEHKRCSDGLLTESNGAFFTRNKIDASYVYCCKLIDIV